MPGLFSRLKSKDFDFRNKRKNAINDLVEVIPQKPKWDDAYTRKTVEPEEIQELLRRCTDELKSRGLDQPLLLLPFRPDSNPTAVRTFIRGFFNLSGKHLSGEALAQDLRLTDPMVIAGVVKWCWSRLPGGIVGWDAYELFKVGEYDSHMARDSFKTFIPLSIDNRARQQIIFDFFSLIAAVAAHSKTNGFGGRKLSRMAAWWAFEQKETGDGFDGGYNAWLNAADATSHLFFAYLRSLSPEQMPTGIELLPRSLQKLLQETEYPLRGPISPTPFALLRRANHFQYRESDRELHAFSQYQDPVQALTVECRQVLKAIASVNQSQIASTKDPRSTRDASWSRFEDLGFASLEEDEDTESAFGPKKQEQPDTLRSTPASIGHDLMRPTTPSWADFLSSGFVDDNQDRANLILPPEKVLPPINTQSGRHSSQSHRPKFAEQYIEPGELASIRVFDLDDAFWWVWMNSLSPEETPDRKSAFGRCAVIETQISHGHWLIMEEMIAGAAPDPQEDAYIAEKKGLFSWTRRSKTISRRKSTSKKAFEKSSTSISPSINSSKTSIGPEAHARVQAKAAQLRAIKDQEQPSTLRHRRTDSDLLREKTHSVAVQPNIAGEVTSALKWVNKYDKGAIKDAYLANTNAGRGIPLSPTPTESVNSTVTSPKVLPKDAAITPAASPLPQKFSMISLAMGENQSQSIELSTPPTPPLDETKSESSLADSATNVDSDDAAETKQNDSKFSQGPLADQPAFVPEDDEDEIASKQDLSQGSGPGIHDRWAQIRKNAADRAATRQSEEQSLGKYSKTTDGDDETSGEETIESRVARIKARVAELTGTMETTTAPQAVPVRR
ncbi:Morphogenesis-related MSB1-like protein [Cladobotryum mycophilum]|uniref:Morphogenesis-related MSB1-like protein n=1 Tax=Cladobotryum mycophilum TaxID=491253 RepID=A0ABR0SKR2_9HYPO